MKIIRKVRPIEVKRAYITAQTIHYPRNRRERYPLKLDQREYLKRLVHAKRKLGQLTEDQLDEFIAKDWRPRERAYSNTDWYLAVVSPREIGMWRRAGGLPIAWTCCSLAQSAQYVKRGLEISSKRIRAQSKEAIPHFIKFSDIISKEMALYPIVFKSGTGTGGRRRCRGKVKGDIDDGNMRSIVLATLGYKKLKVYFGIPRDKSKMKK